MSVSEATYRQVALEDPTGRWEWICGFMRRKPFMTTEHEGIVRRLVRQFNSQLDDAEYGVGGNVRVRRATGSYYVPDMTVLPLAYERRLREHPRTFEVYDDPMPLIVEVWSPSTGDYDVDEKLAEYRRRGDLEVWRIHPYEHTLIAWIRRSDGSYRETLYTSGAVTPSFLPGVTVDFDALFD
jgi:Uma2 family endonuclease